MTFEKLGFDLEPNEGGSLLAGPTIRGLMSCTAVLDGLGHPDGGVKIGLALGKASTLFPTGTLRRRCSVAWLLCFAVPFAETISGRGCWILTR